MKFKVEARAKHCHMMKATTWMTVEEAAELGVADLIEVRGNIKDHFDMDQMRASTFERIVTRRYGSGQIGKINAQLAGTSF